MPVNCAGAIARSLRNQLPLYSTSGTINAGALCPRTSREEKKMVDEISFNIDAPKFSIHVTENYEGDAFHCVIYDSQGEHYHTQSLAQFADLYNLILNLGANDEL